MLQRFETGWQFLSSTVDCSFVTFFIFSIFTYETQSSIQVFNYDIYVGGIWVFFSQFLLGCTQSLWIATPMTCLYLWTSESPSSSQWGLLHMDSCFSKCTTVVSINVFQGKHPFLESFLCPLSLPFIVSLHGDSHPTFWCCHCSLPSNRSD